MLIYLSFFIIRLKCWSIISKWLPTLIFQAIEHQFGTVQMWFYYWQCAFAWVGALFQKLRSRGECKNRQPRILLCSVINGSVGMLRAGRNFADDVDDGATRHFILFCLYCISQLNSESISIWISFAFTRRKQHSNRNADLTEIQSIQTDSDIHHQILNGIFNHFLLITLSFCCYGKQNRNQNKQTNHPQFMGIFHSICGTGYRYFKPVHRNCLYRIADRPISTGIFRLFWWDFRRDR